MSPANLKPMTLIDYRHALRVGLATVSLFSMTESSAGLHLEPHDSVHLLIPTSLCSAFELLRYPGVTAATLAPAVPELADVDATILARVDIDGTPSRIILAAM